MARRQQQQAAAIRWVDNRSHRTSGGERGVDRPLGMNPESAERQAASTGIDGELCRFELSLKTSISLPVFFSLSLLYHRQKGTPELLFISASRWPAFVSRLIYVWPASIHAWAMFG